MRTCRVFAVLAAVIVGVAGLEGAARGVTVSNLATDWSDASNPNGLWTYRAGALTITTHQATWQPTNFIGVQPAWAFAQTGSGIVPAWFKSTGAVSVVPATSTPDSTYDAPTGRIITHTTDPGSGVDANLSNARWTSPGAGTVVITGDTWQARKSLGRSNDWALLHNDVVFTGGSLASNDAFTSTSPFLFQNGSGGAGVLAFAVNANDTIDFRAVRTSTAGDFVGVDLNIVFTPTPVPEPASLVLLGAGSLALLRWRRTT